MCLQAPKMAHSHFCSQTCVDDAEAKGPMILEVPYGHTTFKNGTNSVFIPFFRRQFLGRFSYLTMQRPINSRHPGDMSEQFVRLFDTSTRSSHRRGNWVLIMHISEKISRSPIDPMVTNDDYRATVEAKGQFVSSGRSEGNENLLYHPKFL